jgi:hypothetical protein
MDCLMTVMARHQRFPLASGHHLDPEGACGLPLTAEVLECTQVMDFDGVL